MAKLIATEDVCNALYGFCDVTDCKYCPFKDHNKGCILDNPMSWDYEETDTHYEF